MKIIISVSTILLLVTLIMPALLHAQPESMLCSAEESTGYDYTNGRWLRERFRSDARYLVRYNKPAWSVYIYETEVEYDSCEQISEHVLVCEVDGDFVLNMQTMKFSFTNTDSYVHSKRKNRDAVVLTLGVCVDM